MKTIKPLGDNVLVEVLQTKTDNDFTLDTPEKYKEKPYRGIIREIGDFMCAEIKKGDVVIFKYFHGQPVILPEEPAKEFLILHVENLICKEVTQ